MMIQLENDLIGVWTCLQFSQAKLNTDEKYKEIAKNWEGDLFFIEPEGDLNERLTFYIDLYHGTCRTGDFKPEPLAYPNPAFTLTASYNNITDMLTGKLTPITAMMTMKLKVNGYIMCKVTLRNGNLKYHHVLGKPNVYS